VNSEWSHRASSNPARCFLIWSGSSKPRQSFYQSVGLFQNSHLSKIQTYKTSLSHFVFLFGYVQNQTEAWQAPIIAIFPYQDCL